MLTAKGIYKDKKPLEVKGGKGFTGDFTPYGYKHTHTHENKVDLLIDSLRRLWNSESNFSVNINNMHGLQQDDEHQYVSAMPE